MTQTVLTRTAGYREGRCPRCEGRKKAGQQLEQYLDGWAHTVCPDDPWRAANGVCPDCHEELPLSGICYCKE